MLIKRLKYLALTLFIMMSGSLAFVPVAASAAGFKDDACAAVTQVDSTADCSAKNDNAITRMLKLVLNVLSFIVGFTAIVMIIIGGFKFVTSNGDSNNVSSARNSILYAIIGLVIVAAAQIMVHFVLGSVNASSTICATTKSKNCTVQLCTKTGQTDCTVKK